MRGDCPAKPEYPVAQLFEPRPPQRPEAQGCRSLEHAEVGDLLALLAKLERYFKCKHGPETVSTKVIRAPGLNAPDFTQDRGGDLRKAFVRELGPDLESE